MSTPDKRSLLQDLGFQPAGHWILDNGRPAPHLEAGKSHGDALYAFINSGDVAFIGRVRPAFGGTIGGHEPLGMTRHFTTENDRRIIESLMHGNEIEILEFLPSEAMEYRGWRLNIGAGLLDALIERLHPAWNAPGGMPKVMRPF